MVCSFSGVESKDDMIKRKKGKPGFPAEGLHFDTRCSCVSIPNLKRFTVSSSVL